MCGVTTSNAVQVLVFADTLRISNHICTLSYRFFKQNRRDKSWSLRKKSYWFVLMVLVCFVQNVLVAFADQLGIRNRIGKLWCWFLLPKEIAITKIIRNPGCF